MPNRMPNSRGYDNSYHQLGRSMLGGTLKDFLRSYATRDRVGLFDDFIGDAINLDNYAVAKVGTGVAFAHAAATNGIIQASTETGVTSSFVSLATPVIWSGNHNASFETRLKINTVATTYIMEAGFVDAVGTTAAVADVDLISTGTGAVMTCGAVFHINTAQTHVKTSFVTAGGFTTQTLASTLLTTGFTAPAADTWFTVKVQLLTSVTGESDAFMWLNGKLVASHNSVVRGHVNGQQLMAGWIFCSAVATGALLFSCDYIKIEQDRAALGGALE